MRQILYGLYEAMMLILVILTIMSIWNDDFYQAGLNFIVWVIFTIDFMIRFIRANDKWGYLKKHPFMVIAIIPFDQFFQTARIIRVIYLFRVKTITKYYVRPLKEKLTYRSITGIIVVIFSILIVEGYLISTLEQSIPTFIDGIIVIFSQLLFFGRLLFEIEESLSIFILTITSMIGILLQGIALQWLFSKAEILYNKVKQVNRNDDKEKTS